MSERADKFFATHFGSRSKAAQALARGLVLKNGKALSPSDPVNGDETFIFLQEETHFVSNGGYKLHRLLTKYPISLKGKTVADIGASTGGFTDCLLQNGVRKVYAIDVGESLLDKTLQNDPRIVRMENTNARYLTRDDFPDALDAVSVDVSFISLTHLLPVVSLLLPKDGEAYALIKPQFEYGREIGKGGILKDSRKRIKIVEDICAFATEQGLIPQGLVNAPLTEKKNVEYMVWLKKEAQQGMTSYQISEVAKNLI